MKKALKFLLIFIALLSVSMSVSVAYAVPLPVETQIDFCSTATGSAVIGDDSRYGERFTLPSGGSLVSVYLQAVYPLGAASDGVRWRIRYDDDGAAGDTIESGIIDPFGSSVIVYPDSVYLNADTPYWLTIEPVSPMGAGIYYRARLCNGDPYSEGALYRSQTGDDTGYTEVFGYDLAASLVLSDELPTPTPTLTPEPTSTLHPDAEQIAAAVRAELDSAPVQASVDFSDRAWDLIVYVMSMIVVYVLVRLVDASLPLFFFMLFMLALGSAVVVFVSSSAGSLVFVIWLVGSFLIVFVSAFHGLV